MLKILLLLSVIGASGFAGFWFGNVYKLRENFFNRLTQFLDFLKTEITFFQTRLEDACEKIYKTEDQFSTILRSFMEFRTLGQEIIKKPRYLQTEEWEIISNFFKGLGRKDVESECANIQVLTERVRVWHKDALDLKIKRSNAYTKLGICAGCAIAIILY